MRSVSRHSFPGDNTHRIHSQLKASNTIYTFERHSKNVLEFAEGSWMFCWNPASAFLRLIIKTQGFIVASVKAADFQACLLSNCTWWQKKQTLFASFFFFSSSLDTASRLQWRKREGSAPRRAAAHSSVMMDLEQLRCGHSISWGKGDSVFVPPSAIPLP